MHLSPPPLGPSSRVDAAPPCAGTVVPWSVLVVWFVLKVNSVAAFDALTCFAKRGIPRPVISSAGRSRDSASARHAPFACTVNTRAL